MTELWMYVPIALWTVWAFVAGSAVGSLLNVCVARLPLEKSIIWPGSRCGNCFQPVRWFDNIPLLSYWILGGRCRNCQASFSCRYFLLELMTGLAFAGLFLVEIVGNIHDHSLFRAEHGNIMAGRVPLQAWWYWLHHAVFVSFLIACSACDLDRREIPLSLTMTGLIVGLIGATLFPWPWPMSVGDRGMIPDGKLPWWLLEPEEGVRSALYPWPVWGPLPAWLPFGSHQSGLATGIAGMLVGTFLLRGVRFVFSKGLGKEALGLGDADLMMMAGAFVGWQPVVVAFFVGAMVTLFFAILQIVLSGDNSLPFGPGLALGTLICLLGWRWIGPAVQPLLFNLQILTFAICGCAACMLLFGSLFRVMRGPETGDPVA